MREIWQSTRILRRRFLTPASFIQSVKPICVKKCGRSGSRRRAKTHLPVCASSAIFAAKTRAREELRHRSGAARKICCAMKSGASPCKTDKEVGLACYKVFITMLARRSGAQPVISDTCPSPISMMRSIPSLFCAMSTE